MCSQGINIGSCGLPLADHEYFCFSPTHIGHKTISGSTFLDDVFRGISNSGVGNIELAILSVNDDVSIPLSYFALSGRPLEHAEYVFSRLTKLTLDLRSMSDFLDQRIWDNATVAGFLRRATNLEALIIKAETDPRGIFSRGGGLNPLYTALHALLHDCTFPNLRVLYLGQITATAQGLRRLLSRCPILASLVIEDCATPVDHWEALMIYIRHRRNQGQGPGHVRLCNLYLGLQVPFIRWVSG